MADPNVRTMPNSKESEMMVLGSMLTSLGALNIAGDALNPEDFYYTEHQIVFRALQDAYRSDKPADVHLIGEELKRQSKLEQAGGITYLATLAQYAGTSAFIEEYAALVQEKSILRRMVHAAQTIERTAFQEPSDVFAALDAAQAQLFQISQSNQKNSYVAIHDMLSGVQTKLPYLKALQERQQEFQEKGPDQSKTTGMPTHFVDLDHLLNGFNKSNLMILGARPSMGKCVVGGTSILDPSTGRLVPIKDLVQSKTGSLVTLGADWKLKQTKPSAFVSDGVKSTFKITTALGREIEATAVHPLLTIKGWKQLQELKVDDRIAVPRALPFFGNKMWEEHKVKMLAYLIADGNLTNATPRFTNTNLRIVDDFKQAAYAFGPIQICEDLRANRAPTYSISLDRSSLHTIGESFSRAIRAFSLAQRKRVFQILQNLGLIKTSVYQWAHASALPSYEVALELENKFPELPRLSEYVRENPITAFLKELGLMGKDAHQKFLPEAIFELTRPQIALFLNRLFSCDGTAYVANCGGRPFPVIAYSSVSKSLISQVQHLLLRFGILSKVRKKRTTANQKIFPSFELEIHAREDLIQFCNEIGIHGKEEAVAMVLQQTSSLEPGWSKDTLPIEIWDLIHEKKGNRGWPTLFKNKDVYFPTNLHDGKRAIRRDSLARIAHVLDDIELMQLATSDVYWDRIIEIEATGEKEVFDLTVDETHNFIAGDIIVHNTALAANLAENICFRNHVPVGMFSLEMGADQLLHRLICSQAQVESEKIQTGSLNSVEYMRIVEAVHRMQKDLFLIDDQPGLKITDLRARARRMKEAHNIGFLVIDYLQLLSGSGTIRSMENRQIEISEISRSLKNLARELDLPILCLAQLSRKIEERQGHRPMMSDLRESGSLEQDADIVMFLSRQDYYDPYNKPGQAELIIAKNRHGATGDVRLTFRKEIAQFVNFTPAAAPQTAGNNDAAFAAFTPRE